MPKFFMKTLPSGSHNSLLVHPVRFLMLLLSMAGFAGSGTAAQPTLYGDWPTYGNGPAHTGYFPGRLNGLPFILKWTAPMPNYNILQPVTGEGRVYVTVGWYYGAMSLQALNSDTGQPLWTNKFPTSYSINPPTYDDGSVYAQSVNNSSSAMWRFNAATGATNWATSFTAQADNYLAPIVVNGTVYADTGYYVELTAYNRTNGAQRFSVPLIGNGCDEWTPAYYGGKVYTWVNGYFAEHNPSTGARNWTMTNATQGEFWYSMNRTVAIADGRAYFTSTTSLFCVDLAQHQNVWTNSGSFSGTPAVANGNVYAISNGVVCAYTTNGAYVNTYRGTNGSAFSGQLIVTDDVLIVAGNYGTYIFKLSDATVQRYITSYRLPPGGYYSSTISLANNTLYIASGDSNVYAYAATPTTAITLTNAARLGNGAFQFGFTNIPGATFTALASTNVALPLSNWTSLGLVTQFSSGQYQFTDFQATNNPQRFYRISSP
jgi:hypothetical protein